MASFEMRLNTKNKLIAPCLFLLLAPLSLMAQSPADLDVFDIQFIGNVDRAGSTYSSDASGTFSAREDIREISAIFHNTGTKPIKSVRWEYLVFRDAQQTDLARIYKFESKKELAPGESRRLRKSSYRLLNTPYKKIRVTRIKYADGTVWRGTTTKK